MSPKKAIIGEAMYQELVDTFMPSELMRDFPIPLSPFFSVRKIPPVQVEDDVLKAVATRVHLSGYFDEDSYM